MSKRERRKEIKRLYPLACGGEVKAIQALKNIMEEDNRENSKRVVCGVPVYGERCSAHLKQRVYMRVQLAAMLLLFFSLPTLAAIQCLNCSRQTANLAGLILHKPKTDSAGTRYRKDRTWKCCVCRTNWNETVFVGVPPAPKSPEKKL